MDNLPELRDIHLPEEIGLFPLGYGTIVLIVLLISLIALFPYFRRLYLQSKKKYAFDILNALQEQNMQSVCKISELLRRICKIKHKKAVALFGPAWIDFLNQTAANKLSEAQIKILVNAPYAPETLNIPEQDFNAVKDFAKSWVEANL